MEADISNSPAGPRPQADDTITVHVNGEPRATTTRSLADLVAESGYADAKIATAVNGDFVAAKARAATVLKPGDHIEIVAPRQGG